MEGQGIVEALIDTSVFIDYLRSKTPHAIRQKADQILRDHESYVCEPVAFELLRLCPKSQRKTLAEFLKTFPLADTPTNLWMKGIDLSQKCADKGIVTNPLDIFIAVIAIENELSIATFDEDYKKIALVSGLEVSFFERK